MNRRRFLLKSSIGSLALMSGSFPLHAYSDSPEITKLTILHTNDVHSRIDPFPMDGSRNEGMAGVARRVAMLKDIRLKEKNVLLFDAGDILQGTPYFNFFGGELEFKLMSEMKYDATTIGNHDFDGGIDGLKKLIPLANFPLLSGNYDFRDTILANQTKPYKVFEKGGIRVGVFGLGIELEGLVPETLIGKTKYQDPIEKGQYFATHLKEEENCDLVVCLSHLGYKFRKEPEKVCDVSLAKMTNNIDIIIGGHTHTFMRQPEMVKNKKGKAVLVNQAGFAGIMLGRLDVYFEKNKKDHCVSCKNEFVR